MDGRHRTNKLYPLPQNVAVLEISGFLIGTDFHLYMFVPFVYYLYCLNNQ